MTAIEWWGVFVLFFVIFLVFSVEHYADRARKAEKELERLKAKFGYQSSSVLPENSFRNKKKLAHNPATPSTTANSNPQIECPVSVNECQTNQPIAISRKIVAIIRRSMFPIYKILIKRKKAVNQNRAESGADLKKVAKPAYS
jgi:hypothetical protein